MADLPKHNSLNSHFSNRIRNLVYTCPVDHSGSSVYVKGWLVPESKKQPIVLVHGLGESTEDLTRFAVAMTDKGFSVYGFDLRGHRQHDKNSDQISKFDQLYLDLLQVVAWVKHKENGKKPIVIGHGTGALVALFFAKGYSKFCHSMVFVSPLFSLVDQVSGYRRVFLRTLDELFPKLRPPLWIRPRFTDKDKEGPLKVDNRLAYELLSAIAHSRKIFQRHRLKTLIICSKEDSVAKYEFLKRLIQKHKFGDKFDLKILNTSDHRLLTSSNSVVQSIAENIEKWQNNLVIQESKKREEKRLKKLNEQQVTPKMQGESQTLNEKSNSFL